MSSFGLSPARGKKSKWSSGNERTIMPNIANIISPGLPPEILHAFLLRFQFEEVQYKMDHLEEETPNVLYGEAPADVQKIDPRSVVVPQVKARDSLVNERRQILDEIEKMYPAFIPPYHIRYTLNKFVRKCVVPNSQCISAIMGVRCSTLFGLEQSCKVRISLRPKQSEEKGEDESYLLIIGNAKEDVDRCYDQIIKIIEAKQSQESEDKDESLKEKVKKDPFALSFSFDTNKEIPPWTDDSLNNITFNYSAEVDGEVDNLLNNIENGKEEEVDNVLTFEEMKRFGIDITRTDISALLKEPTPPGNDNE